MCNSHKCPSIEQLKQLAVGRLSDPPAGSLEQHLLECDVCAQQTAQLHQADTLMDAMKQVGQAQPERSPEEAERLERLMSSLSGLHADQVEATILSNPQGPNSATSEADDVTRELSAAWRAPESGDELGRIGGYRILKVLGAGGMGGVFLAEDLQLRRRVALKLMRPRAASAPGAAERFLREARAAAALRHDHIITIYQVGEEAGVPFLAMEYLEGESLDDRLRRESLMPVSEVVRIGREIAEGLAAAHAKGLIHRDIKPANVWLEGGHHESGPHAPREESRGGTEVVSLSSFAGTSDALETLGSPHAEREGYVRVKLLDFGLARSAEADTQLTSSGMIVGTPSYMAPEQASGETVDARVDLFSLGVVLYRMTTGQLPFPGKNVMGILKALATVTPASPQLINPAVPSELSDLIDRLLAKDRNARPASAREVVKVLAGLEAVINKAFSPNASGVGANGEQTWIDSHAAGVAAKREGLANKNESGEPGGVSPRTVSMSDPSLTQVRGLTPPGSPVSIVGDKGAQPPRKRRVATALASIAAMLLLAVTLLVQTRGGTLKIEAADGIDASVVKEQVTIRDTVSGKTYEVSVGENSMRPGQYEIVLRDPASGLKVSTERVEIQRGNSTPLRITLQADVAANSPMKKLPREGEAPAEPRATSGVATKTGLAGASPSRTEANKRAGSVLTGLEVGPVVNTLAGIIPRPARLPGIARWQAVTAVPRLGAGSVAWSKLGQIVTVDGSNQLRFYDSASLELRHLAGGAYGSVTVSSDGQTIAWGNRIHRLNDPDFLRESSLWGLSISPDGKLLAGQRPDGKLGVETIDGAQVRNFDRVVTPLGGQTQSVQWSPDSRRLCVLDADLTTVSILNLDGTTAASFATGHTARIHAMSWSPDGTLIATGTNTSEVRIASVKRVDAIDGDKDAAAGGKLLIEAAVGPITFYPITSLAWSPDSQRLAIGMQGGLAFADRNGKEFARAAGPSDWCSSLAWSPDSREVAACQANGLIVWTADGKFARAAYRPRGEHFPNVGVEWNKAGTLAVTSDDGTVRLWESTGQPGPLLDAPGTRIRIATWNPEGDKLLTSAEGPNGPVARTWSGTGQPGERLAVSEGNVFRWHSDGRRVISNWTQGTEFWVHDLANGRSVVGKTLFAITSIASQTNRNMLVIGGRGNPTNNIGLWHDDGTPGPAIETSPSSEHQVAWHPTDPIFAASNREANIGFRIGNADGKWVEHINLGVGPQPCLAWSPDGRWLAMSEGGTVSLRAANGGIGTMYQLPQGTKVTSLAWSPDSRALAIGTADHRFVVRDLFADETKWVVQHLPPQLNAKGEVARHGAAVVFSDAGELLHVAHSVAAKSAGPARANAEPVVAGLPTEPHMPTEGLPDAKTAVQSQPSTKAGDLRSGQVARSETGPNTLLERYSELDGLISMQVETLTEPGKTQLLKPSEFVKLVEKLAHEPLPSFHNALLDQPVDLQTLADPKLPVTPANTELRATVPRAIDGEYDVTFSATAPTQPEWQWFGLGLVSHGRPCEFYMDLRHAGLQRIDGQRSTKNETTVDGQLITAGAKIEIACHVRHDGITILKDGEELLKWQGDPARLSAAEGQSGLGNAMTTLRCPPGWTIDSWTLTPRGKGMSRAADPTVAKHNAVRQLLDDGYRLFVLAEGRIQFFGGDYPAQTLLPPSDRILGLDNGSMSSRMLQAASQLPNLQRLALEGGCFRPEFVPQINQFTQLRELYLYNLNLRDEDLANLTILDKLTALGLTDNSLKLTDGLVDQLVACRSLRSLYLAGNAASEESLMKLDRLIQLDQLNLSKSPVTDRVLDRLQTLPNLKVLSINETPATAARVEAFRKAKPNCQVEWSEKK